MIRGQTWHVILGVIVLLVVPAAMLWPGLHGAFLVDDQINLSALNLNGGVTTRDGALAFVFGNTSGPLGRPLSMLSFLINDQAFPGSVADYRYTNILIHVLCGLVLFLFCRYFLRALGRSNSEVDITALLIALSWAVIPLNVSTALYVIQRMTELSALFTLLGLVFYLKGRRLLYQGNMRAWFWILFGVYGFGLLAILSKESGALIFVYALACEIALILSRKEKANNLLVLMLVMPIAAIVSYILLSWPDLMRGYQVRNFGLIERLLTESRVLWSYIGKLLIPIGSGWGLVNDDIVVSRSIWSPASTIAAILSHAAVIVAAFLYRKKMPLFLFAVVWFYGGHLLESTVIPLELYFEHRNYLPAIGILFALIASVMSLDKHRLRAYTAIGVFIVVSFAVGFQQAKLWGNPDKQVIYNAKNHPESVRAHTDLVGLFLANGQYREAEGLLRVMSEQWADHLHIDLLLLKYQCAGVFSGYPDVASVISKREGAAFSGNLPAATDAVMEIYQSGTCGALSPVAMIDLLKSLGNLPRSRAAYNATLHYYQSQVYRDWGDLNNAMTALDRAKKIDANSLYWFTGATYLASAGLMSDAREHLGVAIDIELKKPLFKRKNMTLYESAMRDFRQIN